MRKALGTRVSLATLLIVALLQCSSGGPIPGDAAKDSKKTDQFAQEAADALDSTLWFFKDSLHNLIQDGSRINKMVVDMTDKIAKLPPMGSELNFTRDENIHSQLEELTRLAKKTLMETPSKID